MTAEARAHYEEGLRLYGDRKFSAAIQEFEAGLALEARREFLFAEAQAYRLAGDCAQAIPLYERFLGSGPSALQVDATRLALDRCARRPAPVAGPAVVPVPPAPLPVAPVAERAPWWHDRWGLGALGAGVAASGVGLGFVIASHGTAHTAEQANSSPTSRYADYDRSWNTAEHQQTIGIVSLAAGGALLAAGVVRFALVRRHMTSGTVTGAAAPSSWPQIVLAPLPGGVLGQVTY